MDVRGSIIESPRPRAPLLAVGAARMHEENLYYSRTNALKQNPGASRFCHDASLPHLLDRRWSGAAIAIAGGHAAYVLHGDFHTELPIKVLSVSRPILHHQNVTSNRFRSFDSNGHGAAKEKMLRLHGSPLSVDRGQLVLAWRCR